MRSRTRTAVQGKDSGVHHLVASWKQIQEGGPQERGDEVFYILYDIEEGYLRWMLDTRS